MTRVLMTRRGFLSGAGALVAAGALQMTAGGLAAQAAPAGQAASPDPYLGEIRMFAGSFAPAGWALCDGSLLSVTQYADLFSLLGTIYGGDGVSVFALPDLRSRLPLHQSSAHPLGQAGGAELVTLTVNELPAHSHSVQADSQVGNTSDPAGALWATTAIAVPYVAKINSTTQMNSASVSPAGDNTPHENMPPFLTLNFIISLAGVMPPRG